GGFVRGLLDARDERRGELRGGQVREPFVHFRAPRQRAAEVGKSRTSDVRNREDFRQQILRLEDLVGHVAEHLLKAPVLLARPGRVYTAASLRTGRPPWKPLHTASGRWRGGRRPSRTELRPGPRGARDRRACPVRRERSPEAPVPAAPSRPWPGRRREASGR